MPETERRVISPEAYEGIVRPAPPVTAEELFEYQLSVLVDKGLARREDGDPFRDKLPTDGKLFIFVPRQPKMLNLAELMARVELKGKTGVSYVDIERLKDLIEVPKEAHLLLDVEDGFARCNTKPSISRDTIQREDRPPYTTFRGIVHAIVFPWVLSHHFMDLVGSRYDEAAVPVLNLYDGQPALGCSREDGAYPGWGAPSCRGVLLGS